MGMALSLPAEKYTKGRNRMGKYVLLERTTISKLQLIVIWILRLYFVVFVLTQFLISSK